MICLKELHKSFSTDSNLLHVLNGNNLKIRSGEPVSIIGSSGPGKSALINVFGIPANYNDGDYYLKYNIIKGLKEKYWGLFAQRLVV